MAVGSCPPVSSCSWHLGFCAGHTGLIGLLTIVSNLKPNLKTVSPPPPQPVFGRFVCLKGSATARSPVSAGSLSHFLSKACIQNRLYKLKNQIPDPWLSKGPGLSYLKMAPALIPQPFQISNARLKSMLTVLIDSITVRWLFFPHSFSIA